MKISESSLRKIVREEIESLHEVDPATAGAIAGAFTPDPAALQILMQVIAMAGGAAAITPAIKKVISAFGGKPEDVKSKIPESSSNVGGKKALNEGAMTAAIAQTILTAVAAMATAGVGYTVIGSFLEDAAKKFGVRVSQKPADAESKFFGDKGL